MTRTTNARVAGFTFLFYIAAGVTGLILGGKASAGEGVSAKLASIAQHIPQMRLVVVLELLCCFAALVLAVTLYAITRDVDPDLALMVLVCRTVEGVIGAVSLPRGLGKQWLATVSGADAPGPAARDALAASLMQLPSWSAPLAAMFFAVGSTFFAYLLVRGRLVPAWLAWLGLAASILLVLVLPLQLVGILEGKIFQVVWAPMAVFEVVLAVWLILKGVRTAAR